jgi:hypothetical protein
MKDEGQMKPYPVIFLPTMTVLSEDWWAKWSSMCVARRFDRYWGTCTCGADQRRWATSAGDLRRGEQGLDGGDTRAGTRRTRSGSGEEAGARRAMRVNLAWRVGGTATASRASSAHTRDRDTRREAGLCSEMAFAGHVARFQGQRIHWPYTPQHSLCLIIILSYLLNFFVEKAKLCVCVIILITVPPMASAPVLFTSLFSIRAEQMILQEKLLMYNITHQYTNRVSCLNSKSTTDWMCPDLLWKSWVINSLTCQDQRKSIGSSSLTLSSAGRVHMFTLMCQRTLGDKPHEWVACVAPLWGSGFFILDIGLGCIASCFTGDGWGYKNTKKGNKLLASACPRQPLLEGKGSDAPCPCLLRLPHMPTYLLPCSLSHHGYINMHNWGSKGEKSPRDEEGKGEKDSIYPGRGICLLGW